jgi:uncharacterized protein YndB with AHSA1/START domain/uncharacterized protein YciI
MQPAKQYFVRLIGTRPGWPDHMTPQEEKVMGDHFQYLKDLAARGKVILAGPVMEPIFGAIILSVASDSEATAIMKAEPSVVAGVHTYEMQPMVVSLLADHRSKDRYVAEPSDRAIDREVTVPGKIEDVWNAWTTTAGVNSFFAPNARVELRVGGPFEIYFDIKAPAGERGSEDCHILSFMPMSMLSYEWNAPPKFGPLRYVYTRVVLLFEPVGSDSVRVRFTHLGWGSGPAWDEVYSYFDRAWTYVFANFQRRMETGPLDWSKE